MIKVYLHWIFCVFVGVLFFPSISYTQLNQNEKHILVSLRIIGNEILLNSGDSTSLVLPITKERDTYKIQFESNFQFNPEEFVKTIDSIVKKTNISHHYFVEVERCLTRDLIYSFEIENPTHDNLIPCANRIPAKDCYVILFTFLDSPFAAEQNESTTYSSFILVIIALTTVALFSIYFLFFRNKRSDSDIEPNEPINPNIIKIGDYQFDSLNSELLINEQRILLSSKESDLLLLLNNAANTTVEREVILSKIWGDEGDYIGRTLDVFISKLRKKLEIDTSLKIINVRSVGYKLIINSK